MSTWDDGTRPEAQPIGPLGWARVVLRGGATSVLLAIGLAVLLLLRLVELVTLRGRRIATPFVIQSVCISTLWIMQLKRYMKGIPLRGKGAMVANHASWLDIFVLNAGARVVFVSKAEVSGWPVIGWLARATGTVFIRRDRREAGTQQAILRERLLRGDRLLLFPEGTSTDGQRVLPFKPTLFAAFRAEDVRERIMVQPVSIRYEAPEAADPRFYGWWGGMEFGPSLLQVLAARRQGQVHVTYHAALAPADMPDRKALAAASERAVREGFSAAGR
ncbi:lysophospholipid acyltransferase family protein [Alterinioella nitratireducens]|uniref:lysophospholipid acyltransferase family protein n=1 Tax=Alterinioella nitratireducens TaxID=2735915 RepID=UPI0015523081|nr:lysophospholipid acyltransferase family protein [Alterinioella nitratireducens]NPD19085.1 1-acyl-sn-glycerol-3-phosphate acyltransferase [Alterinioella nitratireducens]